MKNRSSRIIIFCLAILIFSGLVGLKFSPGAVLGKGNSLPDAPSIQNDRSTLESEANKVINSSNQFAFDLYSFLKSEPGNIFYSPLSLSVALAMTYEGARGETAEEIRSVFHFSDDMETLRRGWSEVISKINQKNKKYDLRMANALWAQKGFPFLPEYFGTIEKYYGGKVANLDFIRETETSRQIINKWVESQTNERIKDLIPQKVLDSLTRLVLTNAIYFKGKWENQFLKENTKEADFLINSGRKVKVPMMFLKDKEFNYLENEDLQLIELPYVDNEVSMLVLLPKKDLLKIEPYLKADKLAELKSLMKKEKVDVYLPKFKFDTKYLMGGEKGLLGKMGMPTAFSMSRADFSGMDGRKDLYVKEVIHQAFVEVNEEGTEAAAATAVIMGIKMVMEKFIFRADHPFVFIIQEKQTGAILFLGRVVDPSK
ncbi:MAG: serpin family protein [Candidatus Saccharicenans sp.]